MNPQRQHQAIQERFLEISRSRNKDHIVAEITSILHKMAALWKYSLHNQLRIQ